MDTAECAYSNITENAELDFFDLFKETDFWVPDPSDEIGSRSTVLKLKKYKAGVL